MGDGDGQSLSLTIAHTPHPLLLPGKAGGGLDLPPDGRTTSIHLAPDLDAPLLLLPGGADEGGRYSTRLPHRRLLRRFGRDHY